MRVQTKITPGRVQVLVDHLALPVTAAVVAAAVHTALSAALRQVDPTALHAGHPDPEPTETEQPETEQPETVDVGQVLAEHLVLGEVVDRAGISGTVPGQRSSDVLREQALRLLDEQGCSDTEVCRRLGISRAQLVRWDDALSAADGAAGERALAVSGGGRR